MHTPHIPYTQRVLLDIEALFSETLTFISKGFDRHIPDDIKNQATANALFQHLTSNLLTSFSTALRMDLQAPKRRRVAETDQAAHQKVLFTQVLTYYTKSSDHLLGGIPISTVPAEVFHYLGGNQMEELLTSFNLTNTPNQPQSINNTASPSTAFDIAQHNLTRVHQRIALLSACLNLLNGFIQRPQPDELAQDLLQALFEKQRKFEHIMLQQALLSNDPNLIQKARATVLPFFSERYCVAHLFTVDGLMPGFFPSTQSDNFCAAIPS